MKREGPEPGGGDEGSPGVCSEELISGLAGLPAPLCWWQRYSQRPREEAARVPRTEGGVQPWSSHAVEEHSASKKETCPLWHLDAHWGRDAEGKSQAQ